MKINDILIETPLPDDWDKEIYKIWTPFEDRINYAIKMSKEIGQGSSRVAFIIPYQGRDTVLKIAKNPKGMAQNDFEVNMLSDPFIKNSKLVIPMIDFDETIAQPTWIHVEKAKPMTEQKFKSFFGDFPELVLLYIKHAVKGDKQYINEDNKYVMDLLELITKYDLPTGDFSNMNNWGIYKGKPVIIDIGLSKAIHATYYANRDS